MEASTDSLLTLPPELIALVGDFLDPSSLLKFCGACSLMREISSKIWEPRLIAILQGPQAHFWLRQQHALSAARDCASLCVTDFAFALFSSLSPELPLRPGGAFPGGPFWCGYPARVNFCETAAYAFFSALHDAGRTAISLDELTAYEWSFRFKAAAGTGVIEHDPWWRGGEALRLRLCADMTVQPIAAAAHTANASGATWSRFNGGCARKWSLLEGQWGRRCLPPWQRRTRDTPTFVYIDGHPTYTTRRHPEHWGVVLDSCWSVLTAFPMVPRGADPHMEDEGLLRGSILSA